MTVPSALKIIHDEHVALAAVLRAMTAIVTDARRHGRRPDFVALRAMLFYVDEFPDQLHHVKESAMLFVRLRECTTEAKAVLDRLDRDHARGGERVRELEHKLAAWELLGEPRRGDFERALETYIGFYLEHMRVEEEEVLPLALRVLGEDDWRMLDRAFGMHRDALTGSAPEAIYVELFRTIVEAMPPQLRPGPRAEPPR
jgi:hemerythrin-like domain-containing protein